MRLSIPQPTYEYTDADGSRLVISSHESQRDVHLDVTENDCAGMFFPFEDAPRVALELLKAAGGPVLQGSTEYRAITALAHWVRELQDKATA